LAAVRLVGTGDGNGGYPSSSGIEERDRTGPNRGARRDHVVDEDHRSVCDSRLDRSVEGTLDVGPPGGSIERGLGRRRSRAA